jgi:DNA invertase Pin-like site-specific DNA recombinase
MKAFSYLRVSGKGQLDGDGFDRQRDKIRKWAKANGHVIEREFREEGVSGATEAANRPALTEMIRCAIESGVKVIVVERADRLSRDLIVSELLLREWQKIGIQAFDAESGTDITAGDASNPTAKMIRQILAVMAEFDKCSIVLKMKVAKDKIRAAGGRCEGVKPFGTFPGETDAIARMKALRRKPVGKAKRMSFAKIADAMDAEGFATRSGGAWQASTVQAILKRRRDS